METGFSLCVSHGQLRLTVYTPPTARRLVGVARRPQIELVLLGCLYYRDDLRARLPKPPHELLCEGNADAALALRWYLAAGTDGLDRLEGDYALAVWEADRQRLVLARDPLGGFPLYYAETPNGLAADTSLARLRPSSAVPDGDYLADCLIVGGSVSEVGSERTVWSGVRRVQPGSAVQWTARGIATARFWDWIQRIEHPRTSKPSELAGELRQRLEAAVAERLDETTACHVSGGLDSTTVAILAQNRLLNTGRSVHAISVVYDALATLREERPYLEDAFRQNPGLIPHWVWGDELLDFDGFANAFAFDEPYPGLWRLPMDQATLAAALGAGATVLMTGVGGDELFEAFPYHLADLVRHGRILRAWREAVEWAKHMHLNAWDLLYPFGIANAWPVWSRLGTGRWLYLPGDLARANEWQIPEWLLPEFAQRYGIRDRIAAGLRRQYRRCASTPLSMAVWNIERRAGNAVGWSLGADDGLRVVHPLLDPRVVVFALGVCAAAPPTPGGQKPLLRRAIADLLPPSLLRRRTKGHFNELFYRGLARNLPHLQRLVQSPATESLGMIDPPRFLATLTRAAVGALGVRPIHFATTALTIMHWAAPCHAEGKSSAAGSVPALQRNA